MNLQTLATRLDQHRETFADVAKSRNLRVMLGLLGPAVRGYVLQEGKNPRGRSDVRTEVTAQFDWQYQRDREELAKLYEQAKRNQWDASTQLDWQQEVRLDDPERPLIDDSLFFLSNLPGFHQLTKAEQFDQRRALAAWMLSQFLHGEQGALFAACQVTQAVGWMDGKLYGSTQVVDEGRHVEVFHRYLSTKLEKLYPINDNLYVVIDSLMADGRWDMKFLGMQILIEGLALGAFGSMRQATRDPLLAELLKYVMLDEARHVAFGVVALRDYYTHELPAPQVREREDWAYEMSVLLKNRFLAHEFYDEYWAHKLSRKAWNQAVQESPFMQLFRKKMFRRIVPNLKRIGLLSDRVRPHYAAIGLLDYENEKAAPDWEPGEVLQ